MTRTITRRAFLAGTAAALAAARGARADGNAPAVIAAVNDIHIKDAGDAALLERAVARLNTLEGLQFVAVLGDVATAGKREEMTPAFGALEALKVPCKILPGNHDVNPGAPDPFAEYRQVFSETRWTREVAGWTLIGFNSCEGAKSDVTVAAEELAWLKEQLAPIDPARPLALFSHHPLNPHTKKYRIKNADGILGLFARHNLRLAAAGHWHGNQVETDKGVLFTTTACCTPTRDNFDGTPQKGFRLFHLQPDGRITTEFVEVTPA